jgi:hypothetical protein
MCLCTRRLHLLLHQRALHKPDKGQEADVSRVKTRTAQVWLDSRACVHRKGWLSGACPFCCCENDRQGER